MRSEGIVKTHASLDSPAVSTTPGCPCAKRFVWGHSSHFLLSNLRRENRQRWVLILSSAASGLSSSGPLALNASVGPQTASHVSPSGGLGATRRPNPTLTPSSDRLFLASQPGMICVDLPKLTGEPCAASLSWRSGDAGGPLYKDTTLVLFGYLRCSTNQRSRCRRTCGIELLGKKACV